MLIISYLNIVTKKGDIDVKIKATVAIATITVQSLFCFLDKIIKSQIYANFS